MIVSTQAPLLHWDRLSVPLPTGADRPHAVENLSLDLRQNEVLCLVGESGSGKSVSAMATMGLLKGEMSQTSGAIRFAGQDLTKLSPDARRQLTGSKLSMVFQEPIASLNPFYTAGAQVSETIRTHSDQPAAAIREKVLSLFEEVHLPNPEQIFRAYPHELSGGQCQRVMIASALALDPAVLIADEPTTALDVTTQAQILSLILALRDNHNTGILFITHDFGVVSEIADRVAVMRKGQLVEVGPREQILTNPQHDYTKALLAAVPKLAPRAARPVQGKPILEVNSVSKTYRTGSFLRKAGREVKAVVDANIHIHGGETLGVVGESGSGKTTLSQCIIRMVEPTSGQVQIAGKDFLSLKGKELRKARQRVQIIFQDPYTSLDPRQKVGDAIAEGPLIHGTDMREATKISHELIEAVGLETAAADRYPHEFSGGQRQRICIARALALQPDLLIADESVSALDVSVQAQILDLLADIQTQRGFAMLFVTHDLRVASQICDRICVMQRGQIVETGAPDQLFANAKEPYTRALLAAVPGANRVFG
ncbi:ABC transporter ATP-binding protein [Litoreibacter albidus]|uniref:Peptide/nickel transport system ATP-binding protein n=1 Tax=Litoreibacter albidus TaxID=670155 RepID=A0A1H3AAY6_9RHOB|nr:ABC transporter ATP-binding protein [Litoreibacter albidus]SDX26029.1 peptide/nickel transport system ATP-binding protein [Litoreibacter albidus]